MALGAFAQIGAGLLGGFLTRRRGTPSINMGTAVQDRLMAQIRRLQQEIKDIPNSELYERLYQAQQRRLSEQALTAKREAEEHLAARGIGDTGIAMAAKQRIQRGEREALTDYGLNLEQMLTQQAIQRGATELQALSGAIGADAELAAQQYRAEMASREATISGWGSILGKGFDALSQSDWFSNLGSNILSGTSALDISVAGSAPPKPTTTTATLPRERIVREEDFGWRTHRI